MVLQGAHICCSTHLFPSSVQPGWKLPLKLIIFFMLMAFDSLQQEELQSILTIVAQGLPPTHLPHGGCAVTAVWLQESHDLEWFLCTKDIESSEYPRAGCWRRAACYVQTSIALPFWNRGEDVGGVKITVVSAIQRVHVLPERELLSFSSASFRQVFQFIIFHEFGKGRQSALLLRVSQNQNLAHSTSPSPTSKQTHHTTPQTWARWTLLMFT